MRYVNEIFSIGVRPKEVMQLNARENIIEWNVGLWHVAFYVRIYLKDKYFFSKYHIALD